MQNPKDYNLTDKQLLFCNEYLIDFNATQAAIRAGYSKNTAAEQGARLLTNVNIQTYLSQKKQKVLEKLEISQERTLREIARISFSDTRKLFNEDGSIVSIVDLDDDTAAAVAGMEVTEEKVMNVVTGHTKKIKLWDKTKALEMLAKHFNLYSDATVQNNTNNAPFSDTQVDRLIQTLRETKTA